MITITIPGHDAFNFHHVVCDYNGTIAIDGILIDGIKERFNALKTHDISVHVVTADTHSNAREQLRDFSCEIKILNSDKHDVEKRDYIEQLKSYHVAAFGNGYNDHLMLKSARLGVAVCQSEGCSVATLNNADIKVNSILDGLDLLLKPSRLIATLRY